MMALRPLVLLVLAGMVVLNAGIAWLGHLDTRAAAAVAQAEARRMQLFQLAEHMRVSSHDLTRLARLYVLTGEPRYLDYHDEVRSIRDGTAPRPESYDSGFWTRAIAEGKRGVIYGPPRSLRDLLRERGVTDAELAALEDSRAKSDRLADLERETMRERAHRQQAAARPLEPVEIYDLQLRLADAPYNSGKAEILAAVTGFTDLVDARVRGEVTALLDRSATLRRIRTSLFFVVLGYCALVLLVAERVGVRPLLQLVRATIAFQRGRLETRADTGTSVSEVRLLASAFNQMAAVVQEDIVRQRQLQQDIEQSHDELRERNELFGRLCDAVDVVFWIGEVDFSRWRFVNPAYERLWGWPVEELYRDPGLFLRTVHPDDTAKVVSTMSAAGAGGDGSAEYRVRTRAGAERWVWSRAFGVRDAQGRVMFTTGTTTDITRRKEIELSLAERTRELGEALARAAESDARFRAIAEAVDVIIWIAEPDLTRFRYINPAFERLLGWTAAELYADPGTLIRTLCQEDTPLVLEALGRAAAGGEGDVEYRVHTRSGEMRWLWTRAFAARDAAGRVAFVAGTSTDITARRQLEAQLRERERDAEAANRAKSAFLATMSHEIRTPMIGITGMLEILARTRLNADQRRAVNVIQQSSQSLLRILGDILDFSKIEAGKLELAPATVSLPDLVDSVAQNFTPPASSKGLDLRCEVDPGLAPAHRVDPLRLRQVLSNFLSNALKFTERGGIVVSARSIGVSGRSQTVEFSVQDTGIGVSEENQRRLFEPFSQADSTTTRRFGGTGLGLSICRRLAELMGGELTMESREGAGTTMRFRLALEVGDPAQIEAVTSLAPPRIAGRRPPSRRRALAEGSLLLLAEDHATNRLVLGEQLALAGFAVDIAVDGDKALALWRKTRYALVFTDLHMPVMDGIALTRAIREAERAGTRPRTPILALTAAARRDENERCLEAGMDDVIVKPTTVPQLATRLRQWLPGLAWESPESAESAPALTPAPTAEHEGFDPGVLAALTSGNAGMLRAIVEDFRESTARDLAALETAFGRQDAAGVMRHAHRICGASRVVGATEMAGLAERIEIAGRLSDWPVVAGLRARLAEAFERLGSRLAATG